MNFYYNITSESWVWTRIDCFCFLQYLPQSWVLQLRTGKDKLKTPDHKAESILGNNFVTCQYWVHCQTILKTCICVCTFCVGIMAKTVLRNNLKKKNECLSGITSELQTLVEGAIWKDADTPALKSSDSYNQLITLGRYERRCRAEEMMGHMRTAGRLLWGRQPVCAQSSREAACQQRVQKAASPCWSDGLQVLLTCFVDGSCYSCCHLISCISVSPSPSQCSCCLIDSASHSGVVGEKPSQARL